MRIAIDNVLAWTYYESHPVEFRTSMKNPSYWVTIEDIHQFHIRHSWDERIRIAELGVWSDIKGLYSELSAYVHGQNANTMSLLESFSSFTLDDQQLEDVVRIGARMDEAIAKLLASLYQETFSQFPPDIQKEICKTWNRDLLQGLDLRP